MPAAPTLPDAPPHNPRRLEFEVVEDRDHPGDWRAEAGDERSEGECYLAIFCGPDAERRAREYADWMNGTHSPPQVEVHFGDAVIPATSFRFRPGA